MGYRHVGGQGDGLSLRQNRELLRSKPGILDFLLELRVVRHQLADIVRGADTGCMVGGVTLAIATETLYNLTLGGVDNVVGDALTGFRHGFGGGWVHALALKFFGILIDALADERLHAVIDGRADVLSVVGQSP